MNDIINTPEQFAPTEPTPSVVIPEEVYLEREDILRLLLLGEKRRRIAAEKKVVAAEESSLNTENALLISNLDKKYGISLNDYAIDTETGKAIKR
jgi:hypothetical protein